MGGNIPLIPPYAFTNWERANLSFYKPNELTLRRLPLCIRQDSFLPYNVSFISVMLTKNN